MITLTQVEEGFENLNQVYFFTVKPSRELIEYAFKEKSKVLLSYFEKRDIISYHVNCESRSGFRHIHGILKLNVLQEDKDKKIQAIQRYVNRNYGYFKIEPIKYSIKAAYDYINNIEGNKPSEYYTNFI